MASLIGKEIGKYRITERIGRGGMAEVYLGVHTHLDRQVAIKVLHSYLLEGGDFIERFKREAKAVASLRHPNIVQVYDFDIQDEIIFMVMEYIEGTNLQQQLVELDKKGKRLPIKQIGSIINDIAGALDYAHSQGMLHRDVKPSNILIDKAGKAYLTDFGIARILGDHKLTATGTLVGTPAYMSPEQGRGEELTEESDIYSLGIVAFEMLTGRVPFDAKTPIGIVQKQISEPVPDISKLVDGVPITAQDVIDRALAKSPKGRYASAEELVGALKIALQALESTESIPMMPSTTEIDEVTLSAPTVAMEEVPGPGEFEQPTVLMEEDQETQVQEEKKPPESKPETKQKTAEQPKRKVLLWAMISVGVVAVAIVSALLVWVFRPPQEQSVSGVVQSPPVQVAIPSSVPTLTPLPVLEETEVTFDPMHTSDGLFLRAGFDYDTEIVKVGETQEQALHTGNGEVFPSVDNNQMGDGYIEFDVDDNSIYDIPRGSQIRIEIEYLDEGTDKFNLQYDSLFGGIYGNGIFKDTKFVEKTNSGTFKTAEFTLTDARFANRDNGADFRISDNGDGAETIRKVTVTFLP
jgi:serine/threonine protein kinase